MAGRKPPERYWRSYGDDPLPTAAEAMDEPFAAFPSWLLRVTWYRCGKDRFIDETPFDRRDMLLRDIIRRMGHDGCGGHAGKVELLTWIEGVTSRPVPQDRAHGIGKSSWPRSWIDPRLGRYGIIFRHGNVGVAK
jgi:hypothetical protein